jgi:hypothetical protein
MAHGSKKCNLGHQWVPYMRVATLSARYLVRPAKWDFLRVGEYAKAQGSYINEA